MLMLRICILFCVCLVFGLYLYLACICIWLVFIFLFVFADNDDRQSNLVLSVEVTRWDMLMLAHEPGQVTGRALICSAHHHVGSRYHPLALSGVLILCNMYLLRDHDMLRHFSCSSWVHIRCWNIIGVVISPCQVIIYLLGIFEVASDYAKWKRFAEALQQFIAMHWSGSNMWIKFLLYHLYIRYTKLC